MIRYDGHAEFQIARRNIEKTWIGFTLQAPDTVGERPDATTLSQVSGRHVMLRVVAPLSDPEYVITAYFDRTKPCG
jgi:hypothetical protein